MPCVVLDITWEKLGQNLLFENVISEKLASRLQEDGEDEMELGLRWGFSWNL